MSTHECPVLAFPKTRKHPNADRMELVDVFGWTCCVGIGQFEPGEPVVYIPPDYVLDTGRPEFAFLARVDLDCRPVVGNEQHRVKVKRLRGVYSQGLVVRAPAGLTVGDDAMETLGIARYEPAMLTGDNESGPSGIVAPKYDVENLRRHPGLFKPGEQVVLTEKIHGCNARYVWANGRMYTGSRTNWKAPGASEWWKALRANPWIENWCADHPGDVLYGEVFGQVQDLKYGAKPGECFFAAFDILRGGRWISYSEGLEEKGVCSWVPLVTIMAFDMGAIVELTDKLDSAWPRANHLAEGVVVRPVEERFDDEVGRVQLKLVSNRYLERA